MQSYMFLVPFIGWLIAVIIKTFTNFFYYGNYNLKLSFSNGGFPSVHTATMITTTTYIGLYDGLSSTNFILAICVAFIVMVDATHLRRSIGRHAAILNEINHNHKLHEKEGHSYFQVFGGVVIGVFTGYILYMFC